MFIKSVKLKNIRSYIDGIVSFPSGSTLLSGDIGSGKSTILLAIEFALFGIRRGELNGSDLLRHGTDSGSVELTFDVNGKEIVVKRTLKRGKGIVQDSGLISVNSMEKEYTPTELKAKILEFLSYPKEKRDSIFRYTVYTPQEEMKRILMQSDRLGTMRKIFGIDKYGRIRDNTKIVLTELRAMRRVSESYVQDLDEKIKEKEETEKNRKAIEEKMTLQKKLIAEIDCNVGIKKAVMEKMEKDIRELSEMNQSLARKQTEHKSVLSSFEKNEKDLSLIEDRIKTNRIELEEYTKIKKPDISKEDVLAEISRLEKEKNHLVSHRAVLKEDIKKLSGILDKGICTVCGQNVHDPSSFRKDIEQKSLSQENTIKSMTDIDDRIKKLREKENKINKYNNDMEKKSYLESSASVFLHDKERLEKEKNYLTGQIDILEKELPSLKEKINLFKDVESKYKIIKKDFESLQNGKLSLETTKSRLEQQIEDVTASLIVMEKEIKQKQESKKNIVQLTEATNWMDSEFLPLTESIEKHIMAMLQKEFNQMFQQWFGIIMEDESLSVRVDEQFTPILEQNGYDTDYTNLSGGEKTAVALAYRLALNKVINSLVEEIKTKDLLILDEPTDGFSAEQLDRIRDVIAELNLRQIILVSHEPKIDTFVDNVIRLHKEGHVTSVTS